MERALKTIETSIHLAIDLSFCQRSFHKTEEFRPKHEKIKNGEVIIYL